jgi:hypothetical protein
MLGYKNRVFNDFYEFFMISQQICKDKLLLNISKISLVTALTSLNLGAVLFFVSIVYNKYVSVASYSRMRLLYIIGVVLILPLILFSQWIVSRAESWVFPRTFPDIRTRKILAIFWVTAICFLIYQNNFLFFPIPPIFHNEYWFLILLFGIPFVILFFIACLHTGFNKIKRAFYYFLILQIGFLVLALFIAYVFWSPSPWMSVNFNAAFSSVVQAVHMKLPLVDYYAQYGYYSKFLSFIFLIVPLTLTSYSVVSALLCIAVFVFLFFGMRNVVSNPFIRVAALMACFYALFYYEGMPYWANLPIRLIFPSLVFWLISEYNLNQSDKLYYLIFCIVTLAIAWNVDTGVVLFFSWLFFSSYMKFINFGQRSSIKPISQVWLTGFLFLAAMLVLYGVATWIMRGVFPDYANIFIFQDLFFNLGIMSFSMKALDSWSLVILVYIAGFVYGLSVVAQTGRHNDCYKNAPTIMFLCFIGAGFFSYFVMRSYPPTIFVVCWPAIIILAIFADVMVRLNRRFIAFLAILPLIFWSLTSSMNSLPPYSIHISVRERQYLAQLSSQRAWIKSLGLEKKEVVILSDNSGIFYMDSDSNSPILIPGSTEILSEVFVKRIVQYIENRKNTSRLILDKSMVYYSNPLFHDVRKLSALAVVTKKSPDGVLTFFEFK